MNKDNGRFLSLKNKQSNGRNGKKERKKKKEWKQLTDDINTKAFDLRRRRRQASAPTANIAL